MDQLDSQPSADTIELDKRNDTDERRPPPVPYSPSNDLGLGVMWKLRPRMRIMSSEANCPDEKEYAGNGLPGAQRDRDGARAYLWLRLRYFG